ncbi:MAG: hypothetical protein RLZZ540_92 [Bacteroidota bacterium]|jgi:hypothetical protein
MDKILVLVALILLTTLSYTIVNFKKIKFSYHITIGIINIWCIIAFLYLITKTDINSSFALFNVILSLVFHFNYKLLEIKTIRILSIGIVWIFTAYTCVIFFSMVNIFVVLIQPTGYLFGFYLLKFNYEKNKIPVYINLLMTWGCLCLTIYFLFN